MRNFLKNAAVLMLAVLFLVGMSFAEEAPGKIGMANPWIEMDSLEALNEAADVNLQLPGVMGITEIAYRLLESEDTVLAELCFSVNGVPYMLRASGDLENDISGVYTENGETAFAGMEQEERAIVIADNCKLARWMNISGQYVLTVEDEGAMPAETFEGIVDEMMNITNPYQPTEIAEGLYYDRTSERAYATVTAFEEDTYAIEIHWSDSASEDNVWNMTAAVTEDGLLTYSDCTEKCILTAEDGTSVEKDMNLIPEGYFEIVGELLLWTGAAEDECTTCVFEPVRE